MEIKTFGVLPTVKERKRQIVCDCGCTMFKIVSYPRFPKVPYIECIMCESAFRADEEINTLATSGDF